MKTSKTVLTSLSAAMDGGFAAIADVSAAMRAAGDRCLPAHRRHRVILHINRLGIAPPSMRE
ncbi:MAG: hypothetical protein OSB43_18445 [Nocardioides sp.]|uniref:hypothetical protein n=1 Tax=Nocardioides sp. TaxID=35761 RepID=UPI002388C07A|nr:hypothetical protein [Nocardioides sp.]MDE0778264.1 hypothetical protein [Nocardioides sp.]